MSPRILLVDDEANLRKMVGALLESEGLEAVEAANGTAALAAVSREAPDAVLLDLMMPGMDGLSALREIRKLDPAARVAMFTAHRERDQVMRAIELGAKDYVVKPFHADRLVQAVNKLLTS